MDNTKVFECERYSATAVPVHPVWSQQSRKRDFLASTSVADQGRGILGACWLVRKSEGDVRDAAYRLIPYLAIGLLIFLIVVFAYALAENLRVISRWLERPYLFVFPAIGVVAAIVLAASVRQRRDEPPFYMVALIFVAAFGTLAISFWPYMIPFTITITIAVAVQHRQWGRERRLS